MSASLSDRLDHALEALRAVGCTSIVLTADVVVLEQVFRERGDQAILFDADRSQEVAWYAGDCRVEAWAGPGATLEYKRGEMGFLVVLDELGDGPLPGTGPVDAPTPPVVETTAPDSAAPDTRAAA